MPSVSVPVNTGNVAIVQMDFSRIFIFDNRYAKADYTNSTGATVTLAAGTLMGRISATQKLLPHVSSAVDGSQFPVGVLAEDYVVANGATQELAFCNYGDVVESAVILGGADTLATVISSRSIRDRIASDTVGIRLVPSVENTIADNQ